MKHPDSEVNINIAVTAARVAELERENRILRKALEEVVRRCRNGRADPIVGFLAGPYLVDMTKPAADALARLNNPEYTP